MAGASCPRRQQRVIGWCRGDPREHAVAARVAGDPDSVARHAQPGKALRILSADGPGDLERLDTRR